MHALPDHVVRLCIDAFGEQRAQRIHAGFFTERMRSFRANLRRSPVDDLAHELAAEGVPYARHPLSPCSFVTDRSGEYRLKGSAPYKAGKLYCQSLASQVPALLPDIVPGQIVLDACAAPGGKATLLAMRGARVLACERARVRFAKLGHTVRLLACEDLIQTFCVDARHPGKKVRETRFAHVLLDPPCSGTGVLRGGDPRSWAHLTEDYDGYIASRARLQMSLAEALVPLVPAGGSLIYSTCSIDPRENEAVVSHMLTRFTDFSLVNLASWRARFQDSSPGLTTFRDQTFAPGMDACLRIDPGAETEGFFVAHLTRRA
jgi:tRNA (cytosine40_48-C5)-methyltransferase